jgi:glucosamine--fructose-6-phosphate aminotransferase (isomerizing)
VQVFDGSGAVVQRELHLSDVSLASLELGPYKHFMQKEIHEQPRALSDTIEQILERVDSVRPCSAGDAETVFKGVKSVQIIACGTSFYAGSVARYWIESLNGLALCGGNCQRISLPRCCGSSG